MIAHEIGLRVRNEPGILPRVIRALLGSSGKVKSNTLQHQTATSGKRLQRRPFGLG
jgi:hypothetical protein